ncbi:MAG: hypothetical protein KatS3mg057_3187 [Herpetosiphonaceae bacterium]|nr:MAG: hypothetical protein KatS3mg057_3187 [Herpetosiphonaceae bacterium]
MDTTPPPTYRRQFWLRATPNALMVGMGITLLLIAILRPLLFKVSILSMRAPRDESMTLATATRMSMPIR